MLVVVRPSKKRMLKKIIFSSFVFSVSSSCGNIVEKKPVIEVYSKQFDWTVRENKDSLNDSILTKEDLITKDN